MRTISCFRGLQQQQQQTWRDAHNKPFVLPAMTGATVSDLTCPHVTSCHGTVLQSPSSSPRSSQRSPKSEAEPKWGHACKASSSGGKGSPAPPAKDPAPISAHAPSPNPSPGMEEHLPAALPFKTHTHLSLLLPLQPFRPSSFEPRSNAWPKSSFLTLLSRTLLPPASLPPPLSAPPHTSLASSSMGVFTHDTQNTFCLSEFGDAVAKPARKEKACDSVSKGVSFCFQSSHVCSVQRGRTARRCFLVVSVKTT